MPIKIEINIEAVGNEEHYSEGETFRVKTIYTRKEKAEVLKRIVRYTSEGMSKASIEILKVREDEKDANTD